MPESTSHYVRIYKSLCQNLQAIMPESTSHYVRIYKPLCQNLQAIMPESTSHYARIYKSLCQNLQAIMPESTSHFARIYKPLNARIVSSGLPVKFNTNEKSHTCTLTVNKKNDVRIQRPQNMQKAGFLMNQLI